MTYYHLADEVDFRLDPDFRPQNNTTMGGDYRPGIFVVGDPYGVSHWCQMYGYWRPWVIEFEGSVRGVEGGYGNEVFIPAEHFDKLRVSRVVPLDAFCRELYGDWGWTEEYYETTFDTEEPIPSHPGGWGRLEAPEWKGNYRYPGDARRESSSWRSQYEARIHRYRGEVGGIVSNRHTAETIQYQRNNNGMRDVAGFDQDIEPWGRYMIPDAPRELPAGWERGEVTFNNPLRVDYDNGGWKRSLADQYGATGKDLSRALLADGYDGLITEDKYGVAEIVELKTSAIREAAYSISELPNVGPTPDRYWGEGGCGYLAIAFQQLVPELKIAVEWDRRDHTVNHAWVYGGGKFFDYMGTQTGGPEGDSPYFRDGVVEFDVDPQEIASSMRFSWSPSAPWENDMVFEASQVIERHWSLYVPEDDFDTYASRTAGTYTYYHNTSNPAFVPDPGYEPNKMYLDAPEGPGLYVTDNEKDWTRFNSGYAIQTPGLRATFTTDKPLQDYPGVVYSPGGIGQTQYWVPAEVMPELNYQGLHEITSSRTAGTRTGHDLKHLANRTANSDVIVRGFCYSDVSFELAQKYMSGKVTARDIISDIERNWGSVGVWWGTVGNSADDFYTSPADARGYAAGAGDEYVSDQWEWMEEYQGGASADAWVGAEVEVVLVAKRPMRDYGAWNPTLDNGEGSVWESTSFFDAGERLELIEVQYSFDGTTWKSEAVGGLTVTAANLPPGLRLENPKPNQIVAYDDDNPDSWLSRFGVGVLSWDDDGVISWVAIQDDSYKRRGIATAMLEYARTIRPDIRHSDELSESGAGWAQAVGSRTAAVDYLLQKLLDECETSETSYHDYAILQAFIKFPEDVLDTHPFAWELKKCQQEARESEYPETDNILVEWLIEINEKGKDHQSRTAANDLRVHLFDSEGHEMFLEPDFEGSPWTYHPKVMQAVRFLADVAQSNGVYWHMDHNEWIPSKITDFKVFDGPNDVTHEIKEFPQLRGHYASRTAAEPGGVLPWTPSHRGYYWITKTDGTLEAVTNDGVNRMFLHEYPHGWEWEVFDSLGFVEGGTFGMALKGGDALRDRANDLLAEFDTRAERRTRGPSWGYQDDYTQAPNTLWSKREAWSNSPWADYDFENPTYAPYGPMTLYRGFSFEANPGVADQLLERLKAGEPVVKVFEDALIESRYSAMQFGDRVGVYWTTDKDYALKLAMVDSFLDDHVGLYIQAHWEGGDHDIDFGKGDRKNYWGNESEVRLLPGTDVKGLEVGIYVGGRWHTSGTGQSFTAERTSPSSARKTTSQRYAERLRREGRR